MVHIHVWLEEREIRGLRPAFRGQLTTDGADPPAGITSVSELHDALDRILLNAGMTNKRGNEPRQ